MRPSCSPGDRIKRSTATSTRSAPPSADRPFRSTTSSTPGASSAFTRSPRRDQLVRPQGGRWHGTYDAGMSPADPLSVIADGWANHQDLLVRALRNLTPEQLALRTAPHQWAVWPLGGHTA